MTAERVPLYRGCGFVRYGRFTVHYWRDAPILITLGSLTVWSWRIRDVR